jgi:solute carrier family 45 protein 1/2/4
LHTTSDEHTPLLEEESDTESEELAGGTILGIHNIAIVLPEFLVSLMASIIFEAVDGAANSDPSSGPSSYYGHNGVVWVLRLGGLCTAFGAIAARKIPATPPELEMRRRLEEMRYLKQLEEDLYM